MRIPGAVIHGGIGWLPCVPFDTDPMDGEPIAQCGSISDQMPCDAGVPQYPGSYGYCPSTPNGYVPELFEQLLGLRGLGRPYWELPGGFVPLEEVARANNAPAPSEALLRATDAERMRQITGGAVQNYQGAAFRSMLPEFQPRPTPSQPSRQPQPIAVRIVRTPSGRPGAVSPAVQAYRAGKGVKGLGDVLCPDGTNQPTINDCLDHGYVDPGIVPTSTPTPTSTSTASQILTAVNNALQPGSCPTGFVLLQGAGVCIPVSSPAAVAQSQGTYKVPGATDWTKIALYAGAAIAAVVVVAMIAKR
jgi:hypothetical protein